MVLNEKIESEHSCNTQDFEWNIVGVLSESEVIAQADCDCGKVWLTKVINQSEFAALFYVDDGKMYCSCGQTPKVSYSMPFNGNIEKYELRCLDCRTSIPRMNIKHS